MALITSNRLIHGDCLRHFRNLAPNSVDLVCTDPPYGIGYMGKRWDTFERNGFQNFIAETGVALLRVMKPGAFLFMTMTPRQDSLAQALAGLADADFDTGFTSLYWTYASGFPKALNVGKALDKRAGRAREVVKEYRVPDIAGGNYGEGKRAYGNKVVRRTRGTGPLEGAYGGFQPKPAVEVIIVAMKPLSTPGYADQAIQNRKGVTWLDDCRIPAGGDSRFPANLLVSDGVLDDGIIRRGSATTNVGKVYGTTRGTGYVQAKAHVRNVNNSGSYSRYFSLDAWSRTYPFLIAPKAPRSEKDQGAKPGFNTPHPTVKPLALMAYLVTLGSRPGDLVLDPFAGSGTTLVAAKRLGRRYLGIEREAAYVAIARKRITSDQRAMRQSGHASPCSAMRRYTYG